MVISSSLQQLWLYDQEQKLSAKKNKKNKYGPQQLLNNASGTDPIASTTIDPSHCH